MSTYRCPPERGAGASCGAKDLGAPIRRACPERSRGSARKARILVCVIFFVVLACLALAAQTSAAIALRGGKLMTVSHGASETGVLVMENGKIAAVGKAGEVTIPKGARVIDVKGMTVYPGLIDSETNLGLTEITQVAMTNDLVEPSDEITPQMHVYDAFHAESELIPVTRMNGITNAIVAPADTNTLPGQSSLVQLDGRSRDDMLVVRDLALMMNFTGAQRRNETWDSRKFPPPAWALRRSSVRPSSTPRTTPTAGKNTKSATPSAPRILRSRSANAPSAT